jgi:N-methylhydantoinase B/oxoprolinase/acetone carboxylase alpha subunit
MMAKTRQTLGKIPLEVAWNRLISIASEQAAAMVNSSFSAVLGEMEDLSAGVFDATGTMHGSSPGTSTTSRW